jgi:opacity protein-like surface antigen
MLSALLFLTLGIQAAAAKPDESTEKKETVENAKSSKGKKKTKTVSKTKIKPKSKSKASSEQRNTPERAKPNSPKKAQPNQGKSVDRKPPQSKKPAPQKTKPNQSKKTPVKPNKKATPERAKPNKKNPSHTKPNSPERAKPNQSKTVNRTPPKTKKQTTPERVKPNKGKSSTYSTYKKPSQRVEKERLQANPKKVTRKPPQKKAIPNPSTAVRTRATQQAQARKKKKMNRRGMTSLGVQGLNYWSGYGDGSRYLDPGLGLAIGTRLLNGVGVELSYSAFSDLLLVESPERLNRPVQAVGQLYLMPSQKFSPFVSVGVVANAIDLQDQYQWKGKEKTAEQEALLFGGVLGAGMEFSVSRHLGLKVEGRYFNYKNTVEALPAIDDAFDISAGVSVYF